jgi:hypothetical protein
MYLPCWDSIKSDTEQMSPDHRLQLREISFIFSCSQFGKETHSDCSQPVVKILIQKTVHYPFGQSYQMKQWVCQGKQF